LFTDTVSTEQILRESEAIAQYICADVFADGVGTPEIFKLTATRKLNKQVLLRMLAALSQNFAVQNAVVQLAILVRMTRSDLLCQK